ncbi:MAG: CHASE2 domain-containing protein [Timaviella obliquedivisa GSE-PSE-MK23-08B]|jgi:CHASE2 domain-containing sensor protein|nr:CHASE2 domain-containing protein [Timaviella obliquedivisa GSE-PSE-MK23-08B]
MSQLIVLNFAKGSLQQGFPEVTTQLWEGGSAMPTQFTGSLPASLELLDLYQKWRSLYEALHARLSLRRARTTFEIDEADITNVSEAEFNHLCQQIKSQLNRWLNSDGFGKVERQLRANLSRSTEIRVVVTTEDPHLRKFPWHLWNFFEDYPYAEIALGTQNYEQPHPPRQSSTRLVKILAVLGNSEGIDTHRDREFLDQLPGAGTVFLAEPPRWELNQRLWDEKGWDILFFAGHSASQVDGRSGEIAINQTESLTIDQLKNALKAAIARGLKLAIFNSCDGLGLARAMADLNIPQLIVMREPVPDQVAQEFLKHFLTAFSGGKSLYQSVREAREKLEGMEDEFPSASWLPVICQNPAEVPPTWKDLLDGGRQEPKASLKRSLRKMVLSSLIGLALTQGMRQLGYLESWELQAYDHLMQVRPIEKTDARLLLITITENDLKIQPDRQGSSLSNSRLEQLIQKITQYQPALIGLDVLRESPIEPEHKELIRQVQQNDKLIVVCRSKTSEVSAVGPPVEILKGHIDSRVGVDALNIDYPEGSVRRQMLAQDPLVGEACQTTFSFSSSIAVRYLQDKGIKPDFKDGQPLLGDIVLRRLEADTGGYHQLDTATQQILLNYRSANPIAPQLTLKEALEGKKLTRNLVAGKIVLIGTVAPSYRDLHFTPYNRRVDQRMPGVIVHAHMVSSLINAALGDENGKKRSLIWWLPEWAEVVWIGVWALAGGAIAWRSRSLLVVTLGEVGAIVFLYGCCYAVFAFQSGWIPLVPPFLALVVAGGTVMIYGRLPVQAL